jgi:uncharacterized protein YlxW (UPF0749 family)
MNIKHISVITTSVVLIVAIGLVTANEYQNYTQREHARVDTANQQLVKQQEQSRKDQEVLQKRVSDLYTQCKVGETNYNLLPVATRALKTTVAPVCGLPIEQ